VYKYADIIIKEAARLEKMVEDIEDYTKMPQPGLGEVNLRGLIEQALEDWRANEGLAKIDIRLDLPDEETTFPGDEGLLGLALNNLFKNAAQAMHSGGTLSVVAYSEARHVIIRVADTGIGIPSEKIPLIFDPFFTSNTQGSGLGLTTVDRIVSGHHGTITVSSTPGEGTEFQIQLPLYPDDMQLSELDTYQRKA
jgi:signal transduction histidine kinase